MLSQSICCNQLHEMINKHIPSSKDIKQGLIVVSFSLFYFFHKVCRKLQPHLSIEVNRLVSVHLKNHFFLPTSRKVLSTFQKICPVGVQFAQTVVHFAHFQVQARKSGVLGWGWGCFVSVHVPERSL